MGAVGEDNVRYGLEGSVQVGLDGGVDVGIRLLLDTHGDHGDHNGAENAEEGGEGDPCHALHGAGDGEEERDDHADDTEDDGAGAVVGESVHHDSEGQDVTSHDEDTEDKLSTTEELAAKSAQQNLTGVAQVLNVRIPFAEKANVVAGICCKKTEADNENDTGDQTQGRDSGGQ